jgi:ketosteroid isomerase-like protein
MGKGLLVPPNLLPPRERSCSARGASLRNIIGHCHRRGSPLLVPLQLLILSILVSCSGLNDQITQEQNKAHRDLLNTYIKALRSGDFSNVNFAEDITFEGPLSKGVLKDERNVKAFLIRVSAGVRNIQVERYIVERDFACIVATLETKTGISAPFCDVVQFADGKIVRVRKFSDPRPLLQ